MTEQISLEKAKSAARGRGPKLSCANSTSWVTVQRDGGMYLPELDLYLDPHGSRRCAFVSHGHSDHFAKHSWTLCSPATYAITQERYGKIDGVSYETPDWRVPFERGGCVLRLLPAGHTLGSAMLHVTRKSDGSTLLYTGDFKLRHGLAAEPAELREADTLILETTFGLPRYQFPPCDKIRNDIRAFVSETIEDGGIPVLLGYSLGKAQEAHAILSGLDIPIMLHSSVARMTKVYESTYGPFPAWKPFQSSTAKGHCLIFPPSSARSATLRKLPGVRTAMLSGWALNPGAKFRYQVDEVFPLSDHADFQELMDCIAKVKPSQVYTVHGYVHEFARSVRGLGIDAWPLARSRQLELDLALEDEVSSSLETNLYGASPSDGHRQIHEASRAFNNVEPMDELANQITREEQGDRLAGDDFVRWVQTCERVAAVSSRLQKQSILAAYLQSLDETNLPIAARWFTARLDDPVLQLPPLQIGWASIREALLTLTGISEREYKKVSDAQNDSGRTSYLILRQWEFEQPSPDRNDDTSSPSWTLTSVSRLIEDLRAARGNGAKVDRLKKALANMSPMMGSYLVRLLTGELRTGSRGGLVEEAIAEAFGSDSDSVREAAMLCGDLGRAALLAKAQRLSEAKPTLFVPIQVMLASPEPSSEAIWKRLTTNDPGGQDKQAIAEFDVWLEHKYDGIRAQAHFSNGRTEFYSRDMKLITDQFRELGVEYSPNWNSLNIQQDENWIVDGEIIAHLDGERLTFHDLQRRLGRKYERELFDGSQVQVQYVVFDILLKNDRSLLKEPLTYRRKELEQLPIPSSWKRIDVVHVDSPEKIEEAFHAAKRAGNEGLIAKASQSLYTPGRRGKSWLKLKKALSTLDVVVVKAEQGHGKRSQVLSSYTFAVRDAKGNLRVIGKAYTGLTDAEIEELTIHFQETTISQKGKVRTVTPTVVLEVAFDSIRPSDRYDSGLAMRFPRIVGIRTDKTPADIDSLAYAESLAGVGVNQSQ